MFPFLASFFVSVAVLLQCSGGAADPVVGCYVGSWAVYRPSHGRFSVEDIDPTLCTHVIYAFAGLNETTNNIISLDPNYDITQGAYARAVALKQRNPSLKVTIAVGGWTEGSTKYSKMAAHSSTRKLFIDSVIAFLRQHKFDGLDLDWEYPANRGGRQEDKQNFVLLCQELRTVFNHFQWLLTAAVGAGKSTVDTAYDLPALARELDLFHLMAYDYHGKWDGVTGHNAPLYARDDEADPQRVLNVEFSVDYYINGGVPPSKLVLGLGLYGRTFLLKDASNPAIAAASLASAFAGPYTREDGFLGYNEVCEKQVAEPGQWRVVWQKAHQAPYMFKDNMWVSYDDDNSLGLKVAFSQSRQLAGVMIWSIDTDDFRGNCGAGRYPLLTAINKALGRKVVPSAPGPGEVRPVTPAVPAARPVTPPVTPVIPPVKPATPADRPVTPADRPVTPAVKPVPDHDVEGDNTIDGGGQRTGFVGVTSDGANLTSFQSFALFALFCLAVQYLFRHSLPGSTGKAPAKYTPKKSSTGDSQVIPTLPHAQDKKDQ